MDLSRTTTSTKISSFLMVVAVIILLFAASMTFLQIKRMQRSAEMVAQAMEIEKAISSLYSHYTRMESEEFRALIIKQRLSEDSWNEYRSTSDSAFDHLKKLLSRNDVQLKSLMNIESLQDTLFTTLMQLDESISEEMVLPEVTQRHLKKIAETLEQILSIRDDMLLIEGRLMAESKGEYDLQSYLTPWVFLIMALLALLVVVISFKAIYNNKKRIRNSQQLLSKIVDSTENIINYYEPVYNESREIADFKIVFANKRNRSYLGVDPNEVRGKSISKVFPFLMMQKEFAELIRCFEEQQEVQLERQIEFNNRKMWFRSIVTPLDNGILVTARNTTRERESEERLQVVNQELLQINKELKEAESFLTGILKTTDNLISSFEPVQDDTNGIVDFTYTYINEQIRQITGAKPEEIIGKKFSAISPKEFKSVVFDKMVECQEKGETVRYQTQFEKDGQTKWFQGTCIKTPKGITITSRDITVEKNALSELQESLHQLESQNQELKLTRGFLQSILDSTDNIVHHYQVIRDDQGNIADFTILYATPNIEKFTGLNPDDVIGKSFQEVYPFLVKTEAYINMVKCIESKEKSVFRRSMIFKGEEFWMRVTLVPDGEVVTSTAVDITQDKQIEVHLKNLNEQLTLQNSIFYEAEVVGSMGSYIWFLDTGEKKVSENFNRIHELEPDPTDISIEHYRKLIHPEDMELYEKFREDTVNRLPSTRKTFRIATPIGSVKHIHLQGQYSKKDGRPISVGIAMDVTERVKAEEALLSQNRDLERMNAELEAFNRVTSHDLQEPLRKIQLFISGIQHSEEQQLSKKGREYLKKLDKAAIRMQALIRNLLTYSKLEQRTDYFETVDLNLALSKAKEDLSGTIEETKAQLHSEKLPTILAIPFQMEQLFTNLLSNALKYVAPKESPNIRILSEKVHRQQIPYDFVKSAEHYYKITIADSGIGFDNVQANKIFDLLKRLHHASEYSGTGIGLAICKKIIENHHGFIFATSELGKGSAFILYLPAQAR